MNLADHDHGMQLIDLADKTLGEVRKDLYGVSPKVSQLFEVVSSRVNDARNMAVHIERDVTKMLGDDRVYPKGRYEEASKAITEAQTKVDALKQADLAALTATKLLEEEAMPVFVGDRDEQRAIEREIESQMSRSTDHPATLTRMAHDPRYAALLASPFGRSQLYERGMNDREVESTYQMVRSEALLWVAEHGTEAQRKAAERVELGEKMQGAVLAASTGVQQKLGPAAAKVKGLGDTLAYEEARRIREAGRAR